MFSVESGSNLCHSVPPMPATNTDDTDPSEQTDLLDAMGDSKSESQSHSEYADSGSPPDHEAEYENSPSVGNRGLERHKMTMSRAN